MDEKKEKWHKCPFNRRQFLIGSGAAAIGTVMLPGFIKNALGQTGRFQVTRYPRTKIYQLSRLKVDEPFEFEYPTDSVSAVNLLIKLGEPALGGIGKKRDVVAFNTFCTHMGGPVGDAYDPKLKVMGPCPFHLTSFDLQKRGLMINGVATQNLPQIELELKGDDIYATGVVGLFWGLNDNLLGMKV